jgi:hypothetical protein
VCYFVGRSAFSALERGDGGSEMVWAGGSFWHSLMVRMRSDPYVGEHHTDVDQTHRKRLDGDRMPVHARTGQIIVCLT